VLVACRRFSNVLGESGVPRIRRASITPLFDIGARLAHSMAASLEWTDGPRTTDDFFPSASGPSSPSPYRPPAKHALRTQKNHAIPRKQHSRPLQRLVVLPHLRTASAVARPARSLSGSPASARALR